MRLQARADVTVGIDRALFLAYHLGQLTQIGLFGAELCRALLHAGHLQQLSDQTGNTVGLSMNDRHRLGVFLGRSGVLLSLPALCQNDRCRRTQFVRGIGRKLTLGLKRLFQSLKHLVKGRGKLADLVLSGRQSNPSGQVASLADLSSRCDNAVNRSEGTAHDAVRPHAADQYNERQKQE